MKSAPTKAAPQPPQMPTKMSQAVAAAVSEPAAEPARNTTLERPAPTPELNPRARVLAEIAERSNADAQRDAAETLPAGDGQGGPAETVDAASPEDGSEEPQAAPVQAAEVPAQPAAPERKQEAAAPAPAGIDPNAEYEFTIDGVKTKIKGSQIVQRVQKGEAADYRLELASKLLTEAKQAATHAQPPAQGAPNAQPAAPKEAPLDEAQLAQFIQYGTPEQAAAAIRALRAQRPDTVTQQGLQNFMVQALPRIVESQLSFREGLAFAQKEYGDLLNDPYLKPLFLHREQELRKAGDKRTHAELYRDIGEDLRKHFNRPAPGSLAAAAPTAQAAAAAPTLEQRQAAKAAAPAAPKLASARLEGGNAAVKPKSREQIIDEMRKSRGQHALSVR